MDMKAISDISRRDFLKLAGAGALGAVLAELRLDRALAQSTPQSGRITFSGIPLYDAPSFNASKLKLLGRDVVVAVNEEVEGDEGNPFNKAWYKIDNEGYTYSGWVQPVATHYQKPQFDIPADGQVGEISVPVSDPRLDPTAVKLLQVDYIDVLNRGLRVMDSTAITFCMDNKLPIIVFDVLEAGNIARALAGDPIGTVVS